MYRMDTIKKTLTQLPRLPGVYIYKDKQNNTLYVGKAKDLKKRVSSYFQRDDAIGAKTSLLVSQIDQIKIIPTHNEFDALLLEAKLIRKFLPKYNAISRDDKSPLYLAITKETLPRILWVRKTSLSQFSTATFFGPFQSGRVARNLLRQIRRIIPYCTQKQRNGKPCFYSHIGLCDPCPCAITKRKDIEIYRHNIRKIITILSGKSLKLLHDLERQMRAVASENRFEEAQVLKNRIQGLRGLLEHHFDPAMYVQNDMFLVDIRTEERESLQELLHIPHIYRIECIDISNTQGKYSTGSLVVFADGVAQTREYRRFRIRSKEAPNDVAMIAEVVKRRFAHPEWAMPDLLVIDGGKGQLRAASAAPVPIIGLAKRFEEIIVPEGDNWKVLKLPMYHKGLQLLMRVRDESHRFALTYHRLLRSRAFLSKI